jgi:hypothetical protein
VAPGDLLVTPSRAYILDGEQHNKVPRPAVLFVRSERRDPRRETADGLPPRR